MNDSLIAGSSASDAKTKAQIKLQLEETALSKNRMSGFGRFFIFLTFVLAGCGLTLAGFLYLELIRDRPLERAMIKNDEARQTLSSKVTDQVSAAKSTMEQRHFALQNQLKEKVEQRLSKAETDLQDGLKLVVASKPTTPNKWRLAEASYLLREANRRLIMQRDTVFALRALTGAEDILKGLGDIALFPVRAKLADDIASLKRINVVDVEEVFIRLETLKEDIPSGLSNQSSNANARSVSAPPGQVWWQRILERIKGLVRISTLAEPVENQELLKLLPTQEVATLARLRIRLAIEQAQLGLLQDREQIYQASLRRAQATILEYFDPRGAREMTFLVFINELLAINLRPELTDLSGSLEMLSKAEAAAE